MTTPLSQAAGARPRLQQDLDDGSQHRLRSTDHISRSKEPHSVDKPDHAPLIAVQRDLVVGVSVQQQIRRTHHEVSINGLPFRDLGSRAEPDPGSVGINGGEQRGATPYKGPHKRRNRAQESWINVHVASKKRSYAKLRIAVASGPDRAKIASGRHSRGSRRLVGPLFLKSIKHNITFLAAKAQIAERRLVMPKGSSRRFTSAAEARTRSPVCRQNSWMRAAVFTVSPRKTISFLSEPISPVTPGRSAIRPGNAPAYRNRAHRPGSALPVGRKHRSRRGRSARPLCRPPISRSRSTHRQHIGGFRHKQLRSAQ